MEDPDECSPSGQHVAEGVDPEAYLRDVLTRIADYPAQRLADLLPWNWAVTEPAALAA